MRFQKNNSESKIYYDFLLKEINKGNNEKKKLIMSAQKECGLINKGYILVILNYVCDYNNLEIVGRSLRENRLRYIIGLKETKVASVYKKVLKKYGIGYRQFCRDVTILVNLGRIVRIKNKDQTVTLVRVGKKK